MITQNDLKQKKQLMVEILNKKGPSLPSAVSREVNLSLLFASALFSELVTEKAIKFSHLKVGGSPLYYIEGQESQLDNFINYLPAKEREAFELLKKESVLSVEETDAGIRVALYNMKDFAMPMKVKLNNEEKIFWRFHNIPEQEAFKKVEEREVKEIAVKDEIAEREKHIKKEVTVKDEIAEGEKTIKKEQEKIKIHEKPRRKDVPRKKEKEEFRTKAHSWLKSKNFEFIEEYDKKESLGTVYVSSNVGKLTFLIIAKNKTKLNEADISLAHQEGLQAKMPVLLLTNGELTKKAASYLDGLGKYIVVRKIVS